MGLKYLPIFIFLFCSILLEILFAKSKKSCVSLSNALVEYISSQQCNSTTYKSRKKSWTPLLQYFFIYIIDIKVFFYTIFFELKNRQFESGKGHNSAVECHLDVLITVIVVY
jgi:hypothetical protein